MISRQQALSLLQLPLARFRLTVEPQAPLRLPDYAGSMLRGAFGHALKSLAPLPHDGNRPCGLKDTCPYCQIFAAPALPEHKLQKFSHMPAPYIIEPPARGAHNLAQGEPFTFGLVLIGHALNHLPLIILAFQRALERGLTKDRSRCRLIQVEQEQTGIVWHTTQPHLGDIHPGLPTAPPLGHTARLTFHTPLRLQKNNRPARKDELDARTLLIALARRWQLLADVHLGRSAPQLDFDTLYQCAEHLELLPGSLYWFDWQRYSSRQRQSMKLGGLIGDLTLSGDLAPFTDLLHLGQWLHVGKETTFGLGHYCLDPA